MNKKTNHSRSRQTRCERPRANTREAPEGRVRVRLTGLKVSRPKLPLLFRLPISVWELDWDIPSKNGLFEEREEKPKSVA